MCSFIVEFIIELSKYNESKDNETTQSKDLKLLVVLEYSLVF